MWVVTIGAIPQADAQTLLSANSPNFPGSVDPGRIEKRFEKPQIPQSVIEPQVPETQDNKPPAGADQVHFTLSSVVIDGATEFDTAALESHWRDFLGKEITLADVYKIADDITAQYRNAGYVLSQAIVPPQRITGGVVHIRIIEGRVSSVVIRGEANGRAALFREWGERIKESQPLDVKVLERYSLLANDLPGVKARAEIEPSKDTPGASDVVFIIEHQYVEGNLSYDNRGSKTSGPREATVGAGFNSLLGLYEKTSANWTNTDQFEELHYFSFAHDEVVDSEGTKLSLTANRSIGKPGGTMRATDTHTRNVTSAITLSHPFIRTRAQSFTLSGGVTERDSLTNQSGVIASQDHIRSVHVGGSYDFSDTVISEAFGASNLIALDMTKGLDILGATPFDSVTKTRSHGRADFLKFTLDATRTQQLVDKFALVAGITAQYATTALLSAEQFGYGGQSYGRAYDSSEITGDSGAAGKLELQYTFQPELPQVKYVQPFTFFDYGVTTDRAPSAGVAATRIGSSVGFGARFGLTDYVTGSGDVDFPLTRQVAANTPTGHGKDPRFFFSLSARF